GLEACDPLDPTHHYQVEGCGTYPFVYLLLKSFTLPLDIVAICFLSAHLTLDGIMGLLSKSTIESSAGTCNAQLEEHEPGIIPQSRGRNRKEDGGSDDLIGQNTLKTAIQNSLPLSELGTPTTTKYSVHSTGEMPCRRLASMEEPRAAWTPPPPKKHGNALHTA
ncbi:hypothetical protein CMEL01_07485, partial [Colletotrichum melonis]